MRHGICLHCGSVLHVPWVAASSRDHLDFMAQLVWTARLAAGCRECGGPLSSVKLDGCSDCAAFLAEVA